ncbi:YSIRK-type signal peptide-containing protein [Streptococcus parauberis]|uniref:YSIRK-type signal peptide-containing protein n=1 Tax=Streptococcus parauberis TaxID=1348 RepID=UPI000C1CC19A|nr:YSIRK-type signal peptide-containing protein [Streptococcus parauberis]PIO79420.1 Immunoglobulin G-binding protein G precursor [Streptococcus parauberis]POS67526.1 Immunoglobulin G-binding protein G precursor [Streptococcus parauberis]
MKENKQMKYFLRKSIFGLASVSAAFIVGGSFVSADEASTNKYIESIADNIDKVDSNDLMKKLSGLKTTSEVDNALKALSESDSANRDAYTAVLANSDVLATRTASQGVEIMDADREAYREINRLGETLHDPTRLEAAIKELTEAKTLDAISAAVNHAHILASEEYNSGISMTDESSDAEWLKAAEDAEKSKISEDEDQTTEDAEEDEDENEGNKEDPKINITPSPKEKETKESRQAMRDKLMAETKEREAKAAKERLEKERSTALTELDHLGAGRLLKNIVSTAKTVEGIKEFMAITRPSLEHAMKVKATSGLTDFLKSQRSAEDTVKDIILTNAKNAALKKLEKLGATDHLKELVENAKTVEDIRTLMAEATPSLEATLSKEEADQVAPEVSEEAPMGSENPMPEGVETDTESSEILNTDKDVERQATGKSVLADIEGKASAPFVQTDAKKPAMEATKEKIPVKAEETKKADQHLPVTGEKVNPFFTGVALSIIASAGMVAYSTKRKEN